MAAHFIVIALVIMAGINGIRASDEKPCDKTCASFDGIDIPAKELPQYTDHLNKLINNRSGKLEYIEAKKNATDNKFCFVFNVLDKSGKPTKECAVSYAWVDGQAKSKSVSCASASASK